MILGITGAIMAFEGDIEHWPHPGTWYVRLTPEKLSKQDLVRRAEARFATARFAAIQMFREPRLAPDARGSEFQNRFPGLSGFRAIRFNRSLHTGDVLDTPTHILVSLSSLPGGDGVHGHSDLVEKAGRRRLGAASSTATIAGTTEAKILFRTESHAARTTAHSGQFSALHSS